MHKLQAEGIACADIDLTGIVSKQTTEEQWYRDIIRELVSCFQLKVNRRTWWREHDDLSCVHRFSVFVEEVLLAEVTQNIVIFVDEIDSVLSLDFPIDDFFAQIRYFYNKRANKPEYNRLTFALLGVATPSDLIADKNRTPFNIGRAVELNGFQQHEAAPLAQGLVGKVSNPQAVLKEVLEWTGGQPFLTQKLCQLVLTAELPIPESGEAEWVEKLVRSQVIENWESQDDPEHLRTIRDRIRSNDQRIVRLLGLYQRILQDGAIVTDCSSEQMALRLSGMVVKQQETLRVYNHIYGAIFNETWVDKTLADLRPYAEEITAWLASSCQDELLLLREQKLRDALSWAEDKSLSDDDERFLNASQEVDKRETQKALEVKRRALKSESLNYYCQKFSQLRVGRAGGVALHKPILLLSVIQLIKQGILRDNRIVLSAELIATFLKFWNRLGSDSHGLEIALPFFHMSSEGFWHLIFNPGYGSLVSSGVNIKSLNALKAAVQSAYLDDELFGLLQNPISRNSLIAILITTWFNDKSEQIEQLLQINALADLQNQLLETGGAVYQLEDMKNEANIAVRNTLFRRAVVYVYDYRCAFCGLQVLNSRSQNFVDAAHIKPFSQFYDGRINNGISLCKNHHYAFDNGWFGINDDYTLLISDNLREDSPHATPMREFQGQPIWLPAQQQYYPSLEALHWHHKHVFRGLL
jgi:predicted restriction endonuclease